MLKKVEDRFGVYVEYNSVKMHTSAPEHYATELQEIGDYYYVISRFRDSAFVDVFDKKGMPICDLNVWPSDNIDKHIEVIDASIRIKRPCQCNLGTCGSKRQMGN